MSANLSKIKYVAIAAIALGATGLFLAVLSLTQTPLLAARWAFAVGSASSIVLGIHCLTMLGGVAVGQRVRDAASISLLVSLFCSFVVVVPPQKAPRLPLHLLLIMLVMTAALVLYSTGRDTAALERIGSRKKKAK